MYDTYKLYVIYSNDESDDIDIDDDDDDDDVMMMNNFESRVNYTFNHASRQFNLYKTFSKCLKFERHASV